MPKNKLLEVIQIVPRLPPSINGVGDYALNLARQLRQDYGIETRFIVGDPDWQGATAIEDFSVQQLVTRSAEALSLVLSDVEQSDSQSVLLHYVNYAYAKRGCPAWLIEGLEQWKADTANSHLVTMFHEVAASGKRPWTSVFWLSRQQRHLAARLARLSDRCLTSKQLYAEILSKLSQGKHNQIPALPVFSNVGEPESVPPLAKRDRQLVVFGSCNSRLRVYQKSLAELSYACQVLGIEKILDVGSATGLTLSEVNGVPVVEMGQQSATEISSIMLNALAGFLEYNPDYLAKSGIFAAYCSHGLLPICAYTNGLTVDGTEPGKNYWVPMKSTTLKDLVEMQAIADNAYSWYQTHNLSMQAKEVYAHFVNNLLIFEHK
jgi:hypothetical protein